MADCDSHASFVAECLQMQFPGALAVPVAASAVGADEQSFRSPMVSFSVQAPPAPDTFYGELGRIVSHSHVDHGSIAGDVISSVRNRLARAEMREIVHRDLVGFSFRQPAG